MCILTDSESSCVKDKIAGFTLLELLLVVAILGILATFALITYQQQTVDVKVKKSAQQIQEILQAATSFYSDNSQWPANCTDTNFSSYLPVNITQNPWGGSYTCNQIGKKFQVVLNLQNLPPTQATQTINRVKSLLPNAAQDPNNLQQLFAEIAQPLAGQQSLIIATIGHTGYYRDGDSFNFGFSCPKGWRGNAVVMPHSLNNIPHYGTCINAPMSRGLSFLFPVRSCSQIGTAVTCTVNIGFYSQLGDPKTTCLTLYPDNYPTGDIAFTYIGWCYNPSTKQAEL